MSESYLYLAVFRSLNKTVKKFSAFFLAALQSKLTFCTNAKTLSTTFYQEIPNQVHVENTICEKARDWILKKQKNEIMKHYLKRFYAVTKEFRFADLYFFLCDDLIVQFLAATSAVRSIINLNLILRKRKNKYSALGKSMSVR